MFVLVPVLVLAVLLVLIVVVPVVVVIVLVVLVLVLVVLFVLVVLVVVVVVVVDVVVVVVVFCYFLVVAGKSASGFKTWQEEQRTTWLQLEHSGAPWPVFHACVKALPHREQVGRRHSWHRHRSFLRCFTSSA